MRAHSRLVLAPTLLGAAFVISSAVPALAASRSFEASCSVVSGSRLECDFPSLSPAFNAEIHYATMQCSGGAAFTIQQFQISAIPPGQTTPIVFQVGGNKGSVGNVANFGSIVDIHVELNTTVSAFIDLSPLPSSASCTASISTTF